jgi:uncharacterized membrane protein YciS (DUF1049 family)
MATDISIFKDAELVIYKGAWYAGLSFLITILFMFLMSQGVSIWILLGIAIITMISGKAMEWIRFGIGYTKTNERITNLERQLEDIAVKVFEGGNHEQHSTT